MDGVSETQLGLLQFLSAAIPSLPLITLSPGEQCGDNAFQYVWMRSSKTIALVPYV